MDGSRLPVPDAPRRAASEPSPSLLDRYEAIADISRAMVAAARTQDWTEVVRLEKRCLVQVENLKRAARVASLTPDDQETRVRLLRSILADDAEIRRLAEPWLAELEHLLFPPPRQPRE
jgi:flagellar protein FliT